MNNMYVCIVTFIVVIFFINFTWYTNLKEENSVHIKHLHALCPTTNIISVTVGGRLGNNIWEYMSLLAILHLYNRKFQFTPFVPKIIKDRMANLFQNVNITELSDIPSECFRKYQPYLVEFNRRFDPKQISDDSQYYHVTLAKYSARYQDILEYGIDKIKSELRFQQKYVDYSNSKFKELKKKFNIKDNNVTYVGMHYRGTDYPAFLRRIYKDSFKGPPDHEYYTKAMNNFKKQYKNVIFILITIDQGWLKRNISFLEKNNNLIVNPNGSDLIEDLVLLSSCNHSIISYGTFAATLALFAGGTTYVYDTGLPLDNDGGTITLGLANVLPNWHLLK